MLGSSGGLGSLWGKVGEMSGSHVRERLDCVGRYVYSAAALLPHDPLASAAAHLVRREVRRHDRRLSVEHVGSTAVSGLPGKGIVDLLLTYPAGLLEHARAVLDDMGFQRQTFGNPFPEERPMRVGAVSVLGREYRVHVHVISASSREVHDLRRFRDRLRADRRLRADYAEHKRQLIERGITESPHYAEAKGAFIREALDGSAEHAADG